MSLDLKKLNYSDIYDREKRINPGELVIQLFGGLTVLADKLGMSRAKVHAWKARGRIPPENFIKILLLAEELNVNISLSDLVFGRPRDVKPVENDKPRRKTK